MCFAKRFGTENVPGNEWSRKSRKSNDARVVELARHQAPAVSPVEQAAPATLADAVELSSQPADVGEPHYLTTGSRRCP
jgi:hypothetical protein